MTTYRVLNKQHFCFFKEHLVHFVVPFNILYKQTFMTLCGPSPSSYLAIIPGGKNNWSHPTHPWEDRQTWRKPERGTEDRGRLLIAMDNRLFMELSGLSVQGRRDARTRRRTATSAKTKQTHRVSSVRGRPPSLHLQVDGGWGVCTEKPRKLV